MKSIKELIREISDTLYYSDKYVQGGVSVSVLGLKENEYPLIYKLDTIELRVSMIARSSVYVSTYIKGQYEMASAFVLYEDIPSKIVRQIHSLVMKHFK